MEIHGKINDFIDYIKRITAIATFCTLKCLIFKKFNDLKQCRNWSWVPIIIYDDILVEMVNMKDYIRVSEIKRYMVEKEKTGCGCPVFDNEDQKKLVIEYICRWFIRTHTCSKIDPF